MTIADLYIKMLLPKQFTSTDHSVKSWPEFSQICIIYSGLTLVFVLIIRLGCKGEKKIVDVLRHLLSTVVILRGIDFLPYFFLFFSNAKSYVGVFLAISKYSPSISCGPSLVVPLSWCWCFSRVVSEQALLAESYEIDKEACDAAKLSGRP